MALRLCVGLPVLFVLCAVEVHSAEWENVKVYRITPINDVGVTNMDTADAPGDVYFGLAQLLLPYMCSGPDFASYVWCSNRRWLSGGDAWMVYRQFTLKARHPFGIYSPCNPDPKTGVFSCGSFHSSDNWPKVCKSFQPHHHHYVNGTHYHTIALPPGKSVGACCERCAADKDICDGFQLLNESGPVPVGNGSTATKCALVTNGSLVENTHGWWSAASPRGNGHCWYDDPTMRQGFAPFCNLHNCSCKAASVLAVGLESHAMCSNNSRPATNQYDHWMGGLACLMDGNWYSTQAPGQCLPDGSNQDRCWWRLESSVNGTREVNASCADGRVQSALRHKNPGCWERCGAQADNATAFCPVACLFNTILGNVSEGRFPLTKEEIVAPYLGAFKPASEGGCPSPHGWP